MLRLFGALAVLCAATAGAAAVQSPSLQDRLQIGLLLIAIDPRPDHLRISEAMRVGNPGPPVTRDVHFALPPAAAYVTIHRGLRAPRDMPDGFAGTLVFRTGVTEIVYSYALPSSEAMVLSRMFPFRIQRLEVVVGVPGVRVDVQGGTPLPPLRLGDQLLARWEARDVAAGTPVVIALQALPVSRAWIPAATAAAVAVVLAAGLAAGLRRRSKGLISW